jgi:hypothetical protein
VAGRSVILGLFIGPDDEHLICRGFVDQQRAGDRCQRACGVQRGRAGRLAERDALYCGVSLQRVLTAGLSRNVEADLAQVQPAGARARHRVRALRQSQAGIQVPDFEPCPAMAPGGPECAEDVQHAGRRLRAGNVIGQAARGICRSRPGQPAVADSFLQRQEMQVPARAASLPSAGRRP